MKRAISAFAAGIVFGLGIAISGMANPAKVVNFFDIAGSWDPSLILVMGGALAVAAVGYRILFGAATKPVFDTSFHLPGTDRIDGRLVVGSALFGIGWGIAGFCPGGAIPALGIGFVPTAIFILAMLAGMFIARTITARVAKPALA